MLPWAAKVLFTTASRAAESLADSGLSPCPTRSNVATIVWPPAAAGPGAGAVSGATGALTGAGRDPVALGMSTICRGGAKNDLPNSQGLTHGVGESFLRKKAPVGMSVYRQQQVQLICNCIAVQLVQDHRWRR